MARRKRAEKRDVIPDPRYQSAKVTKFINNVMERGKKSIAEGVFYGAIDIIDDKMDGKGLEVFEKALDNSRPLLEVKSRRVGGSTYQVPIEVRHDRAQALATRWIISFAKKRKGLNMAEKLASELMSAAKGEGDTIKKKDDTHRMAEANKAFAHFRW
ncbi:MAG: 30S ribosomal protein S7 [Candidatus Electryonea clarkiae]|nr:30S ribosomal protein S7 [Candidatus Electryonea clarkiae]MDP8288925.1 30S ribosomal protein S7 [Candidatus Electryonea clarkiae]